MRPNPAQEMSEHDDDPDVALMLRIAAGDRAAFEELVRKYQKLIFNGVYRYTGNPSVAEELAQDVFLRIYRAAPSYQPDARFTTWLYTIVRNVCLNYRSRAGKLDRRMTENSGTLMIPATEDNPETALIRKKISETVQDAIHSLPESLRLPLVLHLFNHLKYDEIAEVLDLSLATVKIRIYRARLLLAEKLKDLKHS